MAQIGSRGYDLEEGEQITLHASGAETADGTGTAVTMNGQRVAICWTLKITASATDAGDTADIYIDTLAGDGTTWVNVVHFAQHAGNGAAVSYSATVVPGMGGETAPITVTSDAAAGVVRPSLFGSQWRARWVIVDSGDHNSSCTFSLYGYAI